MKEITSPTIEYSDEELCALAASGCRDAEEELVKRYFRSVRMCARPRSEERRVGKECAA